MMIKPSKELVELYDILTPWLYYNLEIDMPCLKDNAPENVKKAYEIYVEKYVSKFKRKI